MGDLRAQAVLGLVGQMAMMLILDPTLQAESDEQADGDGEEMQKELLDAVQLSVGQVNVEHNILPSKRILPRPRCNAAKLNRSPEAANATVYLRLFPDPCSLSSPSAYNKDAGSSISRGWVRSIRRHGSSMPEHIKKQILSEIAILEHELQHELPAEIKKAVAMGDLSENAEYHMAKQRQHFVDARLGQLKRRMAELSLVNLTNIPRDKTGFGSTVVVFDSTKDEEIVYRLVTSEESDVSKGLISTTSPIGRGLVGKRVGDIATIVTPNGKRELEVLKLITIHDEAAAALAEAGAEQNLEQNLEQK
jgi:transcription elongation factor GreA